MAYQRTYPLSGVGQWELAAAPFAAPHADWLGNPSVDPASTSLSPIGQKDLARRSDERREGKFFMSNLLQDQVNIAFFRGEEIHPLIYNSDSGRQHPESSDRSDKRRVGRRYGPEEILFARWIAERPNQYPAPGLKGALEAYNNWAKVDLEGQGFTDEAVCDSDEEAAVAIEGYDDDAEHDTDDEDIAARASAVQQVASLYPAFGEYITNTQTSSTREADCDTYERKHSVSSSTEDGKKPERYVSYSFASDEHDWVSSSSSTSSAISGPESFSIHSSTGSGGLPLSCAQAESVLCAVSGSGNVVELSASVNRSDFGASFEEARVWLKDDNGECITSSPSNSQVTRSTSRSNNLHLSRPSPRDSLELYRRRFHALNGSDGGQAPICRLRFFSSPLPTVRLPSPTTSPTFPHIKAASILDEPIPSGDARQLIKASELLNTRLDTATLPLGPRGTGESRARRSRSAFRFARKVSSGATKKVGSLRRKLRGTFSGRNGTGKNRRKSWYSIEEMEGLRRAGKVEGFYQTRPVQAMRVPDAGDVGHGC